MDSLILQSSGRSTFADDAKTPSSVSIIGMGYVGLCSAVCFASSGTRVFGVEVDEKKRLMIQGGVSPIHERDIEMYLTSSLATGNFSCGSGISDAVEQSGITFVTVGTPSSPSGEIDLRFVEAVASELGDALREKRNKLGNRYHLVVIKSTVTPGTTMGLVRSMIERKSGMRYPDEFGLCVNPEFLREGSAIEDTFKADAVVIGSDDERSLQALSAFYRRFYGERSLPRMISMGASNAEIVKYSINTFRATQLSFLNSLSNLCERIPGSDVGDVIKGLSSVTRLDERYLRPGLGYGGSCLPKDVRALTKMFLRAGVDASILVAATAINELQPRRALLVAQELLDGCIEGRRIAILGLTFKAGTDDVRESVAIKLAGLFVESGSKVSVYDPQGMENAKSILGDRVSYASSASDCLARADCCILTTEWEEFRNLPPEEFRRSMSNPVIIDGKRILDARAFARAGVEVYALGKYHSSKSKILTVDPIESK